MSRSIQSRVAEWVRTTLGAAVASNASERSLRAAEEAIELAQACGADVAALHRLVDYVFSRPAGEPGQEIAGTLVSTYAVAAALGVDANEVLDVELARIHTPEVIERVRRRQGEKRAVVAQSQPNADELTAVFADAGYTYPGTPAAGVRLLLSEVSRFQSGADADRRRYASLLTELNAALCSSPLDEDSSDPVKHVARLCELTREDGSASLANMIGTLRARHKRESDAYPADDEFLEALDDLTDGSRHTMAAVAAASAAYYVVLQDPASDHASVAAALALWMSATAEYLDE